MARLPKCPMCEIEVEKVEGEFVKHSSKTYHIKCFEQFEIRKQHRYELLEYICELYKVPMANGFVTKQIKEYETQYGYTLKGMQMSLYYFHEIQGNPVIQDEDNNKYKSRGIGIVPHIYDEAKRYFIKMQQIQNSAQNITINTVAEVVYIQPTKKRQKNFIDIKGIANE
jgi:hypothetical protein